MTIRLLGTDPADDDPVEDDYSHLDAPLTPAAQAILAAWCNLKGDLADADETELARRIAEATKHEDPARVVEYIKQTEFKSLRAYANALVPGFSVPPARENMARTGHGYEVGGDEHRLALMEIRASQEALEASGRGVRGQCRTRGLAIEGIVYCLRRLKPPQIPSLAVAAALWRLLDSELSLAYQHCRDGGGLDITEHGLLVDPTTRQPVLAPHATPTPATPTRTTTDQEVPDDPIDPDEVEF